MSQFRIPQGPQTLVPVGTRVTCTMNGRSHWTGTVIAHCGIHNDLVRVRRDNGGGVSDWEPSQWAPLPC